MMKGVAKWWVAVRNQEKVFMIGSSEVNHQ